MRAEQAVEHLVKAIELDPGYADAHSNLGNALMDLDSNDQARTLYQRALTMSSTIFFASANSIIVLSRKNSSLSMPA